MTRVKKNHDRVLHFYVPVSQNEELCYNVGMSGSLSKKARRELEVLLKDHPDKEVTRRPRLIDEKVVEIGPLPQTETAFSSNAVTLLHDCGFGTIKRVEVSRRIRVPEKTTKEKYVSVHCDRMRECVYENPLTSFEVAPAENKIVVVPVMGDTLAAIEEASRLYKLGLSLAGQKHFHQVFNNKEKRNPTIEEWHQIKEMISDHSMHITFNSPVSVGGKMMPHTMMQLVKKPWQANPRNSVIAFSDNASAIRGGLAFVLQPSRPGEPSPLIPVPVYINPSLTVETHCYPTGISPWPGAETGIGGCYRDDLAKGRGGNHLFAIAGFCVGNLWIPGYVMPWERQAPRFNATNMASPLKIMLDAPGGTWDYGNKYGVPTYLGITRTFGMLLPNGEHYAYWKPIMLAGLVGTVREEHIKKGTATRGLKIVAIGGPAYKIGFGGGSGSSGGIDEKNADVDYNAVQRGNAGMGHLTWRVIRTCVELGLMNPIISIHDQGAAGPCNVLTELIERAGGKVYVREIKVGDRTMTVLEIWICEYQERYGLLIHPDDMQRFRAICKREGCPVEELGEVTGDGRIVVYDSLADTTPVDLAIEDIRAKMPLETIEDVMPAYLGGPVKIPGTLTVEEAVKNVLRLPSVCSKEFHVHRMDRSVTGLRVRDQVVGPYHLPVSDFAISAVDFNGTFGVGAAIGECPPKMMLDPRAGARMAVAEMLLNLSGLLMSDFEDIKISVNWMWPAKGIPGGVAKMYFAMEALTEALLELRIAGDGGKDSSSLFTIVDRKLVKSPETLVLTAYVTVPDITKFVTPDLKRPGKSRLMLIDVAKRQSRLGGSAFLQTLGQLGDECPDVDMKTLAGAVMAEQMLVKNDLILASHDRNGDGGLFVNLMEMAAAGDCGASIWLDGADELPYKDLFAEEAGKIIEYLPENQALVQAVLDYYEVPYTIIGQTLSNKKFEINYNGETVFSDSIVELRHRWRETSYQIEKLRINPKCALAERRNMKHAGHPAYHLNFAPEPTPVAILTRDRKPKVAIIRNKVSTGDRETAEGFRLAGFESYDVAMWDLITGKATLDDFQVVALAPGFSYEDTFGAGKGWAMQFLRHPKLRRQFQRFMARPDTAFLGVCNGCQAGAWLNVLDLPLVNDLPPVLFVRNDSKAFESRFVTVELLESRSILFKGMEGARLGAWVAHGEGKLWIADKDTGLYLRDNRLVTMAYVDDKRRQTERYPFNPNGSHEGWTGFCDITGRVNFMMPHLMDRAIYLRQWPWIPAGFRNLKASPWILPLQNLRRWCEEARERVAEVIDTPSFEVIEETV